MQQTKPRILFVDNHDDTRLIVEMWLAKYNYDVATAESIAGGPRLSQSERFDLYVLDTNLSDGKGAELCAKIRRFDPLHPGNLFFGDEPARC